MASVGLVIAVENYHHKKLDGVRFAAADATGFADAIKALGFDVPDDSILIDTAATKTQIESRIRYITKQPTKDDQFYLYYVGHGFSETGGFSNITCYDTVPTDLENTSISMGWLFERLRASKCRNVALFLDCSERGLLKDSEVGNTISGVASEELEEFFGEAEQGVCFSACKSDEGSFSAPALKHGIWAYHLIEALEGRAPSGFDSKTKIITASSLQNYLALAVPRSVRTHLTGDTVQTPWMFGSHSADFKIADVSSLLAKRSKAAKPGLRQLKRALLRYVRTSDVAKLSGNTRKLKAFGTTEASRRFIAGLGRQDVEDKIKEIYTDLKREFKFKRAEIEVPPRDAGYGTIITSYFDVELSLSLDPSDLTQVMWNYDITNIRNADKISGEEFEAVFGKVFDELEFEFSGAVKVADLIDTIEALEIEGLKLDYNPEATRCSISMLNSDFEFVVTSSVFTVKAAARARAKELISAFSDAQIMLVNEHGLKVLPFDGDE